MLLLKGFYCSELLHNFLIVLQADGLDSYLQVIHVAQLLVVRERTA